MGRKKLTKILLASGSRTNSRNHQNETALDICIRKGFNEITELFKNPPPIVSAIQRDEIRASKYVSASSGPSSAGKNSRGRIRARNKNEHSDKKSGGGSSGRQKRDGSKEKSGGGGGSKGSKTSQIKLNNNNNNSSEFNPNWSPYGCHYHPNPEAFPPPKIDSLPNEPLRSGELYYLDLAGNIHKV
jgi:ankyrin repeat protein